MNSKHHITSLIALVGMPNSGKTSLFNKLTGSHQRVANYPGITVERKLGEVYWQKQKRFDLVDLPGIYSLDVTTLDEKVTKDYLFGKPRDDRSPHLVVLVLDATNLQRGLYLAQQLKQLNWPFIVALNMMDEAQKRGQELDLSVLKAHFQTAVIPTIATKGQGLDKLIDAIEQYKCSKPHQVDLAHDYQKKIKSPTYIQDVFKQIDELLKKSIVQPLKPDTFSKKIDTVVLHRLWGPIVLLVTLTLVFQMLFSWAAPLEEVVEHGVESLGEFVARSTPPGNLQSLLVDGVIHGVGSVLVFLPHIAILFAFILILEDMGYLGRAAFLMNSLMARLGLPGKAVIPLLSSHACAIPGIMGARIIEDQKERLATIMIAPLTTCSARLPVYTLLIAALIPDQKIFGFLGLPGLTLMLLYLLGISSAFIAAFVFRRRWITGEPSIFLMDLPPYRLPSLINLFRGVSYRSKLFIKKAGTVILSVSIILWVLVSYPQAPNTTSEAKIHHSYAAHVGKTIQPLFAPLGFDWRLTTALIPSFAAREVMVSSLSTVLSVEQGTQGHEQSIIKKLSTNFSAPSMLALIIWFVYAPQCISTFAVIKKETASWKWPLVMMGYTLALAYFLALLTFQLASLFF